MNTVFLDRGSFPEWISLPDDCADWLCFDNSQDEQRLNRSINADILVVNKVILDSNILAELPRLKMVAVTATGTNNVDLDYCKEHGIAVNNVSGYAGNTVAEHTIMLLLALRRNLITYRERINTGCWQESPFFCDLAAPVAELSGTRLGIIGHGAIGRKLGQLAQAFGMQVFYADSRKENPAKSGFQTLDQLIKESDHIAVCCPLTPGTTSLINRAAFIAMKPTAVVLNTSRGGIVDEEDLVAAIKAGDISGAALDVSVSEPLHENSPLLKITDLPNVLLTPHIAWGSDTAMMELLRGVVKNIADFKVGNTSHFLVPAP